MTTATLTFDTLQFVQRLKKAGIKENEAEAIAEAVRDVQNNAIEDMVTRRDLGELATKHDIDKLDIKIIDTKSSLELKNAEIRAEIAQTRAELVKWVVSVGVLQTAIVAALVMKLIPG
jgi:hypothetical protein